MNLLQELQKIKHLNSILETASADSSFNNPDVRQQISYPPMEEEDMSVNQPGNEDKTNISEILDDCSIDEIYRINTIKNAAIPEDINPNVSFDLDSIIHQYNLIKDRSPLTSTNEIIIQLAKHFGQRPEALEPIINKLDNNTPIT